MSEGLFRVIYTAPDGVDVAGNLLERDLALGLFSAILQSVKPRPERIRVMSDHEWQKVRQAAS